MLVPRRVDWSTVSSPPVIFIHAPRENGLSTLLASMLIQFQDVLGLDGAVVLSDRISPTYMGGVMGYPSPVVANKPPDRVLKELINMQQHRRQTHGADQPLPRLALAVDDMMYTPKLLQNPYFQRDLKQAKDFNVVLLFGTADASLLPKNVHTYATHVMATRTVTAEEPKLLRRLFSNFKKDDELVETLLPLARFEYLVGCLRARNPADVLRTYVPTYYVASKEFIKHTGLWASDADGRVRHAGDAGSDDDDGSGGDGDGDGSSTSDDGSSDAGTAAAVAGDGSAIAAAAFTTTKGGSGSGLRFASVPSLKSKPVVRMFNMDPELIEIISLCLSKL